MWMTIARLASVSALTLAMAAGAALAEGEDLDLTEGEPDVEIEIEVEIDDPEVLIDPICIECSGEGEWTDGDDGSVTEEPRSEEDGDVVYDDEGEDVQYEYLEDGEVPVYADGDGGFVEPTSTCGGCESWHDGGPVTLVDPQADDGRAISRVYRDALCATAHFDDLAVCAEAARP